MSTQLGLVEHRTRKPFCFARDFNQSSTHFVIRISIDGLEENPNVRLVNTLDETEKLVPFEVLAVWGSYMDINSTIRESKENYKIGHGQIWERFNLQPRGLYKNKDSATVAEIKLCREYGTRTEDASDDAPLLLNFLPSYDIAKDRSAIWDDHDPVEHSRLGAWVVCYNSKIIFTSSWDDDNGIKKAVDLMHDTEASQVLFALMYPDSAQKLISQENAHKKRNGLLDKVSELTKNGEITRISNRAIGKELRQDIVRVNINMYRYDKNRCAIFGAYVEKRFIPLGVDLSLVERFYGNPWGDTDEQDAAYYETALLASLEAGTGWKALSFQESKTLLHEADDYSFKHQTLLIPRDIYALIESDLSSWDRYLEMSKDGNKAWF